MRLRNFGRLMTIVIHKKIIEQQLNSLIGDALKILSHVLFR